MPIERLGRGNSKAIAGRSLFAVDFELGIFHCWAGKYEVKDRGSAPVACRIFAGELCESAWPRRSAAADPATEAGLRPRLFHPAWRFGGCSRSARDPDEQ